MSQVQGALASHADAQFRNFSPTEQQQVQHIFVQLVCLGQGTEDTRRMATRAELGSADWSLVKRLADSRLVVTNLDPTQRQTVEIAHETGSVQAVSFHPDGKQFATAGEDKTIRVWTLEGEEIYTFTSSDLNTIWDLSYSPNGDFIASVGRANQVKMSNSRQEIKALKGHDANGDVWGLSFNPQDNSMLATAGRDATVKLWSFNRATDSVDIAQDILLIQGHRDLVERFDLGSCGFELNLG